MGSLESIKLDRINWELLYSVLRKSQAELKSTLAARLRQKAYAVTEGKGYLYGAGDVPVLLVAHLDTVHREAPDIICASDDGRYLMSPQGIGGDDRCGIYMILQILHFARCHVCFLEDEEIGCQGARAFAKSHLLPEVNYIVEMDRHGHNDAVFYGCDNPEFTDFVCSFGFSEAIGSCSDISVVAPHLNRAAVNISSGYYNEHRLHEHIDLMAVQNNIDRIAQMVTAQTEAFPYMERRQRNYRQQSLFDFPLETEKETYKLLMPLPDTAQLVINGCILDESSRYMIDREGHVYARLAGLEAVIESENSYACDRYGKQIDFSVFDAVRLPVLSYEAAIEQLYMESAV